MTPGEASSGDGSPRPSPASAGAPLILLFCLAEIVGMSGFGSFPALLSDFRIEWQLNSTEAGWINGIYFGAYMAAVPVLVGLTDRVDPRGIYLASALLASFSLLGFAVLAEGFWSALVFRAFAGIGLAGTYMPGLKALTDHVPERLASRAVAFYTASFSIGSALSFYLTGVLTAAYDWRWTFALLAAGPLLAVILVALKAPRSEAHHLSQPQRRLLDFRPVLRNRRALAYVLAYSAHNWELFALRSWLAAFLVFAQSLQSPGTLGAAWNAPTVVALVIMLGLPSSVLGNEAAQRFGRRPVVLAIMSASALIAFGLGFTAPLPFFVIVLCCFLYGITVTADSASITSGALAAAEAGQRGATMAVHSFIGFAGAFAGPVVFGGVLDVAGGAQSVFAWGLAFASAGLAVAVGPLVLVTLGRRSWDAKR